jgi:hypothetical protein
MAEGALRTQIYLTARQRRRLDEIAAGRKVAMAAVIRDAVDAYLDGSAGDISAALAESFGSLPDLVVPSRDEWDRGSARRH